MHVQSHPLNAPSFVRPHPVGVAERDERWGWPEAFIALQLLWGIVLFIPGAQSYRIYIKALPYVLGAALLVYYFSRETRGPLAPYAKWLLVSFALLLVNLLQPTTHMMAGIGQIVFQICIAAPAFWMARAVRSEGRLTLLLWVLFASSLIASAVGILQVYFPEQFLPPEFSALSLSLNPDLVSSLTYVGADGRSIIRPPGLSDIPGGAAVAAMLTMVLGLTLAMRRDQPWIVRAVCVVGGVVGMTTLFLTHVRSLSLVAAGGIAVCAVLQFRQGRTVQGAASAAIGTVLVAGAYLWAVSVGGDAVVDRFLGLLNDGVIRTFEENRGLTIRYTMTELITESPFGAGIGRWGMMQTLLGDSTMWFAPAIHVETQPTGWLMDGGVPLLFLYVGALVLALCYTYRLAIDSRLGRLQDVATVLLCLQLTVVGFCLSGPVFNTQLGIQFWAVTGALFGATSFLAAPLRATEAPWKR